VAYISLAILCQDDRSFFMSMIPLLAWIPAVGDATKSRFRLGILMGIGTILWIGTFFLVQYSVIPDVKDVTISLYGAEWDLKHICLSGFFSTGVYSCRYFFKFVLLERDRLLFLKASIKLIEGETIQRTISSAASSASVSESSEMTSASIEFQEIVKS